MFNFFKKIHIKGEIFNGHFIDVKAFFVARFNEIPSITFIGELDVTKAFDFITAELGTKIVAVHRHSFFNHADKNTYFNNAILVLTDKRMIEVADNFCQLLYTIDNYVWADQFAVKLAAFKAENNAATSYTHTHVVGFAKATEMN